jgi:cytochrome c551/c552
VFACAKEVKKTDEKPIQEKSPMEMTPKEFKESLKQQQLNKSDVVPLNMKSDGIGPIKPFKFGDLNDEMASNGQKIFKQKCTACHNAKKKMIGPAMKGIYDKRSPAWVMNMMLNPTEMLKKDPAAIALLKEYNNVPMINQNLSEEEARALAEYFRTL